MPKEYILANTQNQFFRANAPENSIVRKSANRSKYTPFFMEEDQQETMEKHKTKEKLVKSMDRHDMIPYLRKSKIRNPKQIRNEYLWDRDKVGFPISKFNEKVHSS